MSGEPTLTMNQAASPVGSHYDAYIDGGYRSAVAGDTFELINAGSDSPMATVARCQEADVEIAVGAARAALPGWRETSAAERGRQLLALSEAIKQDHKRLVELEVGRFKQRVPRRRWGTL